MERRLRLREEVDFRRIRAEGRAWSSRWMTLLVVSNGSPHNRYGMIVGKRVGKAVARNLVKRRLREVTRRLDRGGRIVQGRDLAFIVRPPLATATFPQLHEAVVEVLTRAALLHAATGGAGTGEDES